MKNLISRHSLIAAAAIAAAGGAAAQSSVTIYGAIGLDVVSASKVYNATTGQSKSQLLIEDNAIVNSRIGVKGAEDLGGGLKAVFDLESSINPDTGRSRGTQFWNRGAYVGVEGGFGSIKFGQQWDVADDYFGNYMVFAYYSPFFFDGFYSLSNYYSNAIKYNSPNIGGFQGGLYYSLGEVPGKATAGRFFQGVATYTTGPFSIGLNVDSLKDTAGSGDTDDMWALGLAWDFGVAKARFLYARSDDEITTASRSAFKASLIDLGVDVPLGAFSLSGDFVKKDVKDSPDDTQYFRFRGGYALSKRTSLNANLIFLKNSGAAKFVWYGAGKEGQKQNIFTLGITHSF